MTGHAARRTCPTAQATILKTNDHGYYVASGYVKFKGLWSRVRVDLLESVKLGHRECSDRCIQPLSGRLIHLFG